MVQTHREKQMGKKKAKNIQRKIVSGNNDLIFMHNSLTQKDSKRRTSVIKKSVLLFSTGKFNCGKTAVLVAMCFVHLEPYSGLSSLTLEHLFLFLVILTASPPSPDFLVLQSLPEFLILPSALGVGIFFSFNWT